VDRYYDRIGDIHLLRERLFNFEAEHRRQVRVRDVIWKTERKLEPPDPEFLERYFQRRGELIREYSVANRDVQQLKLQCEQQGLEIEEPNLPSFDEANPLDQSRRDEPNRKFVNARSVDGKPTVTTNRLAEEIDIKARVAVWRSDVPKEELASPGIAELSTPSIEKAFMETDVGHLKKFVVYPDYFPTQSTQDAQDFNEQSNNLDRAASKHFSAFQGDRPQRRYSEPHISAIHSVHGTGKFDVLCKSCRDAQKSTSVR